MRKTAVFLVIPVLFFYSVCFAFESPKEVELLFMAKKAYEDGFYEVSLGMLDRFQNEYKDSDKLAQVRLLSGQCYFNQGRYLEALNIFERLSVDEDASSFKDAVYFWMAEVHFKGGNFQRSAQLYQKLITQFPHSSYCPSAYYSLGWSYSQLGSYKQAVQAFEDLLKSFPEEPQSKDGAFKLIECLYNLKEYSQLKNKINPILKLYASDALRLPYLYFYLAESEYYMNDFDQASKNYLKAAQTFKDQKVQALAKLGLGWSYLKLAKFKEAEEVLAEIKQESLDKKSLEIFLLGQAGLMFATNRIYEAKDLYQQLINTSNDPFILMQAYLGRADAFYNLAEYAKAQDSYNEALAKVGTKGAIPKELMDKLHYNLGLSYIKQGKIDSGVELLKGLTDKSDADAQINLFYQIAEAYVSTGELAKAEEIYKKILKLYPDSAYADYAQYRLGLAQLKEADYDEAVSSFGFLLKRYPQSKFLPDTVYALGSAYFQKADYLKSGDIFAKFKNEFKDSPLRAQAFYMLGASYLNLEKIDAALNIFKDILKLYPQNNELLQKTEYEIADCYYKLGQEEEAAGKFKILRTKYPDSSLAPDILLWLGKYYYRRNEINLARRYFAALTKDYSNSSLSADAFYALGLIFSDENNFPQAADSFKNAIKFGNFTLKAQGALALGDIYLRQGAPEEAISQFKDIIKGSPDLAKSIFPRIADAYYRTGDYDNAKLFYSKSIGVADDKEIANIRFGFAEVLEAKGEFDAAIQQYLLAADFYKHSPGLLYRSLLRAAKLYEDGESFKDALKIYKRIIESAPDSPEAVFAKERVEWIKSGKE